MQRMIVVHNKRKEDLSSLVFVEPECLSLASTISEIIQARETMLIIIPMFISACPFDNVQFS